MPLFLPIQWNSGLLFVIITSDSTSETCSEYRVVEKLSPAAHGFEGVKIAWQKNKYFGVSEINTKSILNLHRWRIMVFKVRHLWCFASSACMAGAC